MLKRKRFDNLYLFSVLALKIILPGSVTGILQCLSPKTGHRIMAVLNFNGFSVGVYCTMVIHCNAVITQVTGAT